MKAHFENILVCLDMSEMDDFLIRYAGFLAETFSPQSVTFMHVMQLFHIPDDLKIAFPNFNEPVDHLVKEELEEKVSQIIHTENNPSHKVIVKTGATTETIIKYSKDNKTSLTLMGKKLGYAGEGGVSRRVTSLSPSSVLLVSETAPFTFNHIWVRMDFSKISMLAFDMARTIKQHTGASVTCHNVFKLPLNYFPQQTTSQEEKLKEQLSRHARKEYLKVLKKLQLSEAEYPGFYSLDKENDEAQLLYHHALQNQADLIVTGSRMKSDLTHVFMDSTSEKLVGGGKNLPVLIVKDRKLSTGFLDSLFD